jgi:hypothetical protein
VIAAKNIYKCSAVLALMLLCACSTAIKYQKWKEGDVVPSTALRFTLQDSSVTFASSGSPSSAPTGNPPAHANNAPAEKPPSAAAGATSNCPSGVSNDGWWTCFNQVAANAVIAPPNMKPTPTVYVAAPDDGSHWYLTTTSISGTAITGQDALYSQVTIKYTNNASSVIAGAGSGAVTGFGIAGPYGGVAGLIIGAAGAAASVTHGPAHPDAETLRWATYLCNNQPVDLTNLESNSKLTPAIYLPLTIKGTDSRPFAPTLNVDPPTSSTCWHSLPNAQSLGSAVPVVVGDSPVDAQRQPQPGDGWLYRFVAMDDPTKQPSGATTMDMFLSSKDQSHGFPYSSCRKVTIEVTWWKELNDAITAANPPVGVPKPRVLAFEASVADPGYVYIASVEKGGVINFKPDCGAIVSTTIDTSNVAAISAAVTNAENVYKAEQSWEASKKTKTK